MRKIKQIMAWMLVMVFFCSQIPMQAFAMEGYSVTNERQTEGSLSEEVQSGVLESGEGKSDMPVPAEGQPGWPETVSGSDAGALSRPESDEVQAIFGMDVPTGEAEGMLNSASDSRAVTANAVSWQLGDQVTGTLASDGTLTVSGTGAMYDYNSGSSPLYQNYSIRKVVVEDGVTYIGRSTFEKCYGIRQVDIAGSVKTVGSNAFIWDAGIKEVILREGIEKLEFFCFGRCSDLETVQFAQSIKKIGSSAFYGCFELHDVVLPRQLETIGSLAFGGCVRITELTIPSSVKALDMSVFGACHNIMGDMEYSLQNIYVESGNLYYKSIGGVMYSKDGKKMIWYPDGRKDKSYTVVDGVETIGYSAFEDNKYLETICLPDSVTVISEYGFANNVSLKNINLPEKLTKIEASAFAGCWLIDDVVVPQGVTQIGYRAFAMCRNLHNITIAGRLTYIQHAIINYGEISDYIFDGCPDDLMVHTYEGSGIDRYMSGYTAGNRVYDTKPQKYSGDTNSDGVVDAKDKRMIYNHISGTALLTGDAFQAGDINGDGIINATDKRMIYNHISGIRPLW